MLKIEVGKIEREGFHTELFFCSFEKETRGLCLCIDTQNSVQVKFYDRTIWNKKELPYDYSLLLILMNKALKVFKKDYPERYEIIKQNLERLKSQIL